jgi:Family of unknown function (DUF6364)
VGLVDAAALVNSMFCRSECLSISAEHREYCIARVGLQRLRSPACGHMCLTKSLSAHTMCNGGPVKNITLALDEKIIQKGRKYASRHNLTLNSLVRKLLEQTIEEESQNWLEECYQLMDQVKLPNKTRKWKREDLYRA